MTRWTRKVFVWASLVGMMASLIGVDLYRAQAQPVTGLDANPFLDLFPSLRTAPAPDWVQPGTRLTYYSIAGSTAGGKHRYIEDPQGNWRDPMTGKHYRQEQVAGGGSGVSGHGYTQINIALLNRAVALLDVRSYGITGTSGPPVILSQAGAIGLPGAGGDFWLNPSVLRGLAGVNSTNLKIFLGPYQINGRRYKGVWIHSGAATWVYDTSTGVLLHSGSEGHGADIQGPLARGDSRQGATFIGQNTLVDMRTTHLPWAFAGAPDWVARVRVLRYQGSAGVHVPGSPMFPTPISTTYERRDGGANWVRYRQTVVQAAPSGLPPNTAQAELVFGPAQLGGLWIAPRALAQLHSGQILDADPVTRVTASVGRIGRIPSGRVAITITESGAGEQIDYAYDANSGMLLSVHTFNRVLNAEIQMSLVSAQ